MSAKIDYTRAELTSLKSQISAHQTALGSLLTAIGQAEGLLNAREVLGEEPVRSNIESKFADLNAAVTGVNSLALTIPTQSDFMDGYDVAVDPE